jgi:hypothetical protein
MAMIEGGFSLEMGGANGNMISLQTESATRFFNNYAVKQTDQYARRLGLYADVVLGKDLEGRFASFNTPKNSLRPRANGCTWNPNGAMRLNIDKFPTCPVEFDGEQCPDVFYGTCFERIFVPGSVNPLGEGAEAQALVRMMVERIQLGLGNDFFNLYNFANHPLIDSANTNLSYAVEAAEFEAYYAQMNEGDCGGLITQLDALANDPIYGRYYNGVIPTGATGFSETTDAYIGDIIADLIEPMIAAASPELQIAIENGIPVNGVLRYPIILLGPKEFTAYRKFITDMAPNNELAYRYMIQGETGDPMLERNVLRYDNLPVVKWDALVQFDATLGTKSHRGAIIAPGNFGVLSNVGDINNRLFNGQGLVIQESPLLKDKGKVYMHTNFRWGAAIADPKMAVMFKTVVTPNS